ncbi:MAG: hypothetical protein ACKV0T_02305 [Planctomycetales bacterium]
MPWNGLADRHTLTKKRSTALHLAALCTLAALCVGWNHDDAQHWPGAARAVAQSPFAPASSKSKSGAQPKRKGDSQGRSKKPGAAHASGRGERLWRATDVHPRHDDQRLAALGILKYTSKRLVLYTDIAPEQAKPLPELMDRCFDEWVEYFGPLPPDREGQEFQMTGYLMADQRPFRETGLLPENLPPFPHGRNQGTLFWLNDQPTDYYRRHLLLHEGTHCYMMALAHPFRREIWYMEGMAELFGTHRFDDEGRPQFRVLPHDREQFPGLGRIRLVEDEVRDRGARGLPDVMRLKSDDYLSNPPYAWAWTVCRFFDGHPRYSESFRQAGRAVVTGEDAPQWRALLKDSARDIQDEWLLFASTLCHGYDQSRSAITFRAGERLRPGTPVAATVEAARGWQSSGVLVEQGKTYRITAEGRFTIAHPDRSDRTATPAGAPSVRDGKEKHEEPAWESEPQGISVRYHAGRPLGMLLATIRSVPERSDPAQTTMLGILPIGRAAVITPTITGDLYFRLNDPWNELHDNAGEARARIELQEPP